MENEDLLSYMVDTMASDNMVMQDVRTPTAIVFNWFTWKVPAAAQRG